MKNLSEIDFKKKEFSLSHPRFHKLFKLSEPLEKGLKIFIAFFSIFILVFFIYFFVGKAPKPSKIYWGVTFSKKQAELLGLDWKKTYLQILDDLNVKEMRLVCYWDEIEPQKGVFNFQDMDFQIREAEKRGAKVTLVIGQKVPRWPECFLPDWAEKLSKEKREEELLFYLKKVVNRYKNSPAIWSWQIENEPFFPFGECPKFDRKFFRKEVSLVKSLDRRPVVISASGTRFWLSPATYGDEVSFSLYRRAYFKELRREIKYFFPPVFYYRKACLVKKIYGKYVFCSELQAEPWGSSLISDLPLREQMRLMNLKQFNDNIEFARETGIDRFYLWGVEWWYYLKEKEGIPQYWEEARKLFQ